MANLGDDFILDLVGAIPNVRVFSIAPPARFDSEFDFLLVVSDAELAKLHGLSTKYPGSRFDIATTQTFDGLGPPAYFHRCHPIDVRAIADRATARREAREREAAQLEVAIVVRLSDDNNSLRLVATLRQIAPATIMIRTTVASDATNVCLHERLDAAIVDASLPDWGAVRAVDWLVATGLPVDCLSVLVVDSSSSSSSSSSASPANAVWRMLQSRGVLRLDGVGEAETLRTLIAHGMKRNTARRR